MAGQSGSKLTRLGDSASTRQFRRITGRLLHQSVYVFQLFESLPTLVATAPLVRCGCQPDGECLGKIFIRVSLRIPVGEMPDKALAIGPRCVGFGRILDVRAAENDVPVFAGGVPVSVIHSVTAFMSQKHL